MGTATCGDIFSCLQSCGPMDQACQSGCVESGTIDAQIQFSDANSCFLQAIEDGCAQDDPACYNQACQAELMACQAGGGGGSGSNIPPPAAGTLSCGAAYVCAGVRCEPTDMACQQECLAGVSAAEQGALNAFLTCGGNAMCQDAACLEASCGPEYSACFPDGNLTCGDFLSCTETCGQDIYCVIQCELDVQEAEQMPLQALGQCAQNNMCTSYDCPQCATEYAACAE